MANPRAAPWAIDGQSLDCPKHNPWAAHGPPTDSPWTIHGRSMHCPWQTVGCPRALHGQSLDVHGLPMGWP
eukprot:2105599-Lingulodinium_polyedra.AAC.1